MINLVKAKGLSIVKWQWIIDHDGRTERSGMLKTHPELIPLKNECGFCDLFFNNDCIGCPVKVNGIACTSDYSWNDKDELINTDHPFRRWQLQPNRYNAEKVLELVKSINPMMIVKKISMFSGEESSLLLDVTQEQLDYYQNNQVLIQNVFPYLTHYERDFIKMGLTFEEWKKHYGTPETSDYDDTDYDPLDNQNLEQS